MKQSLAIVILLIINLFTIQGQTGYPTPPKNEKMLFYLQRSHNRNTIIYDINTLPDGKIDLENPIKVYWIRYEEGGRKMDLSFIQRRAFGVNCKLTDKQKSTFILHFNNFDKREMLMAKTSSGSYKVFMKIGSETAELENVFIKSENNSLGMPLSFKYIEVSGISIKNRKKIAERINL